MSKIIVLDELTAAQIAAGEVIERPASVVKEAVENSLDAGASKITVEIKSGGVKYIRIADNGCGFEADDAVIAFDKHATSKIRTGEDLENVHTLGFRGEALASIAAVADVELLSRTEDAETGVYVHIKGSEVIECSGRGCAKGTSLTVRELFYNTPARYKFLKKDATEAGYVSDIMQKIAIANPDVAFTLISNGQEMLRTPGGGDLKTAIFSVFGRGTVAGILPVKLESDGMEIEGYVGVKEAVYGTRGRQIFYVNGRNIKSKIITSALDEAYRTVTMKHQFPLAVLKLTVPYGRVDVNVHPAKTEVRFSDESSVYKIVYRAVTNALLQENRGGKPCESVDNLVDKPVDLWKNSDFRSSNNTEAQKLQYVDMKTTAPAEKYDSQPETGNKLYRALEENMQFVRESDSKKEPFEIVNGAQNEPVRIEIPEESAADIKPTYNENDIYTEATIVGQIFDTYIILEHEGEMAMIDQHAAHERLMYESIRESLVKADETPAVSPMLLPETVELSPSEMQLIRDYMEYFTKIGFEIDEFGNNAVIVRAVPTVLSDVDAETLILDALSSITDGKGPRETLFCEEAVYTMACKAAIKANQKLTEKEMKELLKKLSLLKNSATCPHGRPIVIRISQHEIEKRFRRCL